MYYNTEELEKKLEDLKTKYEKERDSLKKELEQRKESNRRERERKKAKKERAKKLPPQPIKPSPDNDPSYNAFIKDALEIDKKLKQLNQKLDEVLNDE